PDTEASILAELLVCMCGGILVACVTGMISAHSVERQSPRGKFNVRMNDVKEYVIHRRLEASVGKRLQTGYAAKYQGKIFDEEGILNDLNPSLRQEIQLHGCEDILRSIPFLSRFVSSGNDKLFLRVVATALVRKCFLPGEQIFTQEQACRQRAFPAHA
ncbi:hypothetical protein HDU83_000368, partial [Entophlyctis luteolus]